MIVLDSGPSVSVPASELPDEFESRRGNVLRGERGSEESLTSVAEPGRSMPAPLRAWLRLSRRPPGLLAVAGTPPTVFLFVDREAGDDDDEKENNLPHRTQWFLLYLQTREEVPHTTARLRAHGYIAIAIGEKMTARLLFLDTHGRMYHVRRSRVIACSM